jgi:ABC-type transporter Mla MlaB component
VIDDVSAKRVVALHGRLDLESLAAFAEIAADLSVGMRCDLTNLKSADHAGMALLARLRSQGVLVVGASPYIEMCINEAPQHGR